MNEVNETAGSDKFEIFIEKIFDDAKKRPLVANIALIMMALSLLSSVSMVPTMWELRSVSQDSGASVFNMTFVMGVGLAINIAAVMGLYRMRRYGIYAVGASGLQAVLLMVTAGYVAVTSVFMSGLLFYFLWNERKQFS